MLYSKYEIITSALTNSSSIKSTGRVPTFYVVASLPNGNQQAKKLGYLRAQNFKYGNIFLDIIVRSSI